MNIRKPDELKEICRNGKPSLLEFYTDWCRPCKATENVIKAQVAKAPGALNIVRVNCDYSEDLVIDYSITDVPTVVIIDSKMKVKGKFVGNKQEKIRKLIQHGQALSQREDF